MGLRLHEQHGVNPTLPVCFWCDKDKGEVALLGAAYKGEAPMRMVLDSVPCEACQEQWKQGIVLFEVIGGHDPRAGRTMPARDGTRFTGRFLVIRPEAAERIFTAKAAAEVVKAGRALVEEAIFSSYNVEGKDVGPFVPQG